jgi:hypothetical protein
MKIPFIIERRHMRRGPHMNSQLREEWRKVGVFPAHSHAEAICKAFAATGCRFPEENLRIAGIVSRVEEPEE